LGCNRHFRNLLQHQKGTVEPSQLGESIVAGGARGELPGKKEPTALMLPGASHWLVYWSADLQHVNWPTENVREMLLKILRFGELFGLHLQVLANQSHLRA
jgi:hypothetical protein